MNGRKDLIGRKTLVAVLASHDSIVKNNELARIFEKLYMQEENYGVPDDEKLLGKFHFVFCGGTFSRLILKRETFRDRIKEYDRIETGRPPKTPEDKMREFTRHIYPLDDKVRAFLLTPDAKGIPKVTVLPQHADGGVTILSNLIVSRQCSIIWPFLSPLTEHWLHPENLALLRLCDLWNVKRLMNAESVRAWFREEAERDVKRNLQGIPLRICMCTSPDDFPWPVAQKAWPDNGLTPGIDGYYRVNLEEIRQESQNKQYDDVLKALDKATELNSQDAVAWNNKGDVLYDLGRNEEALKAYDKVIEINPQCAAAWHNKGDVLYYLGRDEEATKAYSKAIELNQQFHQEKQLGRYEEEKYKTIALIAHDAMKSKMVDFAIEYENELSKFKRILATGTTGQEVINACRRLRENKKVKRCLSGPRGGDIQIATEILFDRCDVVVFFIDPLNPHPHIEDIRVVFSACMAEIADNNVRIITNEVHAREWIEETIRRR